MTYAVDSNVIIDILIDDPDYAPLAVEALSRASRDGNLIACDVVWAEASSHFTDKVQFRKVMSDFGIAFSAMSDSAAIKAGELWNNSRREDKRRGKIARTAITPDFMVGAHALEFADALITRDRGFLRKWFKTLKIVNPSERSGNFPA